MSSCEIQKEYIINLKHEYDIEIHLANDLQSAGLLKPKIFATAVDTIITFIDVNNKMIRSWSLTKNRYIDSIDVSFYRSQFIQDYFIISNDSILLAFNTTYFLMKHDKCVIIADRKKNILDRFSFVNAPVLLDSAQNESINRSNHFYSDYTYFPLLYWNGRSIASLASFNYKYCDEYFRNKKILPLGFIYPSSTQNHYEPIDVCFNCPQDYPYYPINFKYPRGAFENGFVHFGFGNEPVLYSLNLSNNVIKSKYFNFLTIGDIKGSSNEIRDFFNYYEPEFLDIVYNPFTDEIYWFARQAVDSLQNPLYQNYQLYSFIIIDKKHNKQGEGVLPFGCQPPIIPYHNGFFAYNTIKTKENNKIILSYFTTNDIERIRKKEVVSKLVNLNLFHNTLIELKQEMYFEKITSHSHGSFLIIPLDNSCKSCLEKISLFFQNKDDIERIKQDLRIIFISTNASKIDTYINESKLDILSDIIYKDTSDLVLQYFVSWVNPRIININEEGIFTHDKVYAPNEIELLLEYIFY